MAARLSAPEGTRTHPQWNYATGVADYGGVVGCEQSREALSARLDGEVAAVPDADLDAHLAICPDCRAWYEDATALTRLARTGPAPAAGEVSEAVLAAAPGPGRARLARLLRLALAALGLAQLGLGVAQMVAMWVGPGHLHDQTILTGATPGHLWHESAAWNVAIGVGFLWVGARRGAPAGIVTVLSAFVLVLALLNVNDLTRGQVELSHVATHAFVLTGYLIVLALTRPSLHFGPPPGGQGIIRRLRRAGLGIGERPSLGRGGTGSGAVPRLPAARAQADYPWRRAA